MPQTKTKHGEGVNKKKAFFKVEVGEKFTEYKLVYGGLELWGRTVGTKENIKDIVRRIIQAHNEIPGGVANAAIVLANYIASMASINSEARALSGSVEVVCELGGSVSSVRLGVNLYYHADYDTGESGWRGEVEAVFRGNDGYIGDAIHEVLRSVDFGDTIDVVHLYRELLKVARHAVNASSY